MIGGSAVGIVKKRSGIYRGCQKNVPVFKRFFLQPLMPPFRFLEHYYGKRYNLMPALIRMPAALRMLPQAHHLKFDCQMADTHFGRSNFGSRQHIFSLPLFRVW